MKRSLEERLASLSRKGKDEPIGRMAPGDIFRAVGLIAHLAYPAQRLEKIREKNTITEQTTYSAILERASRYATSEEWQEAGERLMAQLLIEPFAAIHEILKEDENHDHV